MSGKILRRDLLIMLAGAGLSSAYADDLRLIAHRGGVVGPDAPENSANAIQTAIARGYWMIEVDVRRTRDGEPVLHHDPTLQRDYGDTRRVEETTWNELKMLRAKRGGGSPVHFEDACKLCGGRMRLMLDLKGQDWPKEFYTRLLRVIDSARVPGPIYSLGGARVKPLFDGRVMVSANRKDLRKWADEGQNVERDYFLFELGSDVNEEALSLCRELRAEPVAAINTFRYTMAKRDEWKGPAEDIARLLKLGIKSYQIDSMYEPLFKR